MWLSRHRYNHRSRSHPYLCLPDPDRNILYQVQTPQGFHNQTLQEAYALALKDPDFKTTDDCSVVKKYLPQEEIKIVKGEAYNMKFTYKEDIIILEQLLKNEEMLRLTALILLFIGGLQGYGQTEGYYQAEIVVE